jgi:hypothetical protein
MGKKRPSAYIFYIQEMRPKLKAQDPSLSFADLSKKIGELWKGLPEDERAPYFEKANRRKINPKKKAE